jgi:nitrous oxidase accessory protein
LERIANNLTMSRFMFIFVGFILPNILFGKTWQVRNVSELRHTISIANSNDTVKVLAGKYIIKDLKIQKPVTIIGQNFPVFDAQFKGEIITVSANNVYIKGIQFQNV